MSISTLFDLASSGDELGERFKALAGAEQSPQFDAFVEDLHRWLTDCVGHGRYLAPGTAERRTLQGQVDYWTSRLLHAGRSFDDIDRIAAFDPSAGRVLPHEAFPYHGLFAVIDPAKFFGREEQTGEYADHLGEHAALLILSESGGGKSSVAMAGVLPELRSRHPEWLVVPPVTPGTRPADTLRDALAAAVPDVSFQSSDPAALSTALAGRQLLVYVDQLEELLTMCSDVRQQAAFSELLAALDGAGVLRLLATMRIDHYERLTLSAACHPLFALFARGASLKTLPPMSLAQIRSVIQGPAERVGLRFAPVKIIEILASESANTPGGLPLLQFALQRLWSERPCNQQGEPLDLVTDETYAKLPTLRDALGSVAEQHYLELVKEGLADACQRLLLELTVIDERLEVPLRRRRAEREVIDVLVNAGLATASQAIALVDGFVDRRLMLRTGDDDARQLEVAHEALFRHWKTFQSWINSEDARATLRETRAISREALVWDQKQRSSDLLKLRGQPLQRALKQRKEHWLDPLAAAYVDAAEASGKAETLRRWGAGLVVVALLGLLGWQQTVAGRAATQAAIATAEAERTAGITQTVALLTDVPALDKLDLAFSLPTEHPQSLPILAQAIDRIRGADGHLVGERKNGGAFFTSSGHAVVQLAGSNGRVKKILVTPIGVGRAVWERWVPIELDISDQEALATVDVGPRISGGTEASRQFDARLVVATVVNVSGQSPRFTRMLVYRIEEGKPVAVRGADRPYPDNSTISSDIAFDASGVVTAVSAWKPTSGREIDATALRWDAWEKGGPGTEASASGGNAAAVTAVAFGGRDGRTLIAGRSDGSVDCGNGRQVGGPVSRGTAEGLGAASGPVVTMRAAAETPYYVALHGPGAGSANYRLSIGDCDTGSSLAPLASDDEGPRPENLVIRRTNEIDRAVMTYTLGGRLMCRTVGGKGRDGRPCFGSDLAVAKAVPVFDESRVLIGYRALPEDRGGPLMTFLDAGVTGGTARKSRLAAGVPTGRHTPQEPTAGSSDGQHTIEIANVNGQQDVVISGIRQRLNGVEQVAISNGGVAVALRGRSEDASSYSLTGFRSDRSVTNSLPLGEGFEPKCMKMSADGRQVLLASEQGPTQVAGIATDGSIAPASGSAASVAGAGVSACAIGDGKDAARVLGSRDGLVWVSTADGAWQPLSELSSFRLGVPALDVTIDATSRFVAAIGERLAARCENGMTGHPLRIWDRARAEYQPFPVASTCWTGPVRAIGSLQFVDGAWTLPIYEKRGASLIRVDYPCLACEGADSVSFEKLRKEAEGVFQAAVLPAARLASLYGIRVANQPGPGGRPLP